LRNQFLLCLLQHDQSVAVLLRHQQGSGFHPASLLLSTGLF
jgi:hypothetical protein